MPLLLPDLDDRRWADLVDEGRALIPLYSPGWTDHNAHDPGITLIELLAWQTEIDLYRINRVPPAHVRKFLALAGVEPLPARDSAAAETLEEAAAETLEEAAARALDLVERPLRAVTLADYEQLALEAPGTQLARAIALANFDPAFPCFVAIGVITVIVLPHLPRHRPFPDAATRRAVAVHLAQHRLAGTRVAVIGPTYLEVAARATVRPFPGTDPAELRRRCAAALDGFLDPLTWPLGRDVYRSEILQVLDETPGVDHVAQLELIANGKAGCGNVCVGPAGLVAAGAHEIVVEGRPL